MDPPTVVIDNGTGYSKMGYAGNLDPSYIIPSTIATNLAKVSFIFVLKIQFYLCFRKDKINLRTQISISTLETKP